VDEKAEKKWNRRVRLREQSRKIGVDEFAKAALGTKQGREYLWWLMEVAGIGRNPYTGNALDTSFKCGELNVGQQIQAHLMEASPEGYLNMLREKQKEQEDGNNERARILTDSGGTAEDDTDDDTGS
jgi:hypothetical protein